MHGRSLDRYTFVYCLPVSIAVSSFVQKRMEVLKKIESLVCGNELKTKTGIALAVKCAQEKTLQITFDSIIDGLVFHAHEALDGDKNVDLYDLASTIAFVCDRGNTVSRLNSLICEAQ
jgi:hypothetical protein